MPERGRTAHPRSVIDWPIAPAPHKGDVSDMRADVRILLVEDEALTREVLAETLSAAGFEVTATCTGDEAAILLADQDRFDLLLTDIDMPGTIDGIGLAEHAREVHPGLPLLFVSGRPDEAGRAGRVPEPRQFMPKPYDAHALLSTIDRLIGG